VLIQDLGEASSVGFILPQSYPSKTPPAYRLFEVQTEENNGTDAGQDDGVRSANEPKAIVTTKGKPLKRPVIIVDTDLRRSPRIKGQKGGFKNPQCTNKNCLGCGA
jgi:hypothetical protein